MDKKEENSEALLKFLVAVFGEAKTTNLAPNVYKHTFCFKEDKQKGGEMKSNKKDMLSLLTKFDRLTVSLAAMGSIHSPSWTMEESLAFENIRQLIEKFGDLKEDERYKFSCGAYQFGKKLDSINKLVFASEALLNELKRDKAIHWENLGIAIEFMNDCLKNWRNKMRDRTEIRNSLALYSSARAPYGGGVDSKDLTLESLMFNQGVLLEVLLDIRDILKKHDEETMEK